MRYLVSNFVEIQLCQLHFFKMEVCLGTSILSMYLLLANRKYLIICILVLTFSTLRSKHIPGTWYTRVPGMFYDFTKHAAMKTKQHNTTRQNKRANVKKNNNTIRTKQNKTKQKQHINFVDKKKHKKAASVTFTECVASSGTLKAFRLPFAPAPSTSGTPHTCTPPTDVTATNEPPEPAPFPPPSGAATWHMSRTLPVGHTSLTSSCPCTVNVGGAAKGKEGLLLNWRRYIAWSGGGGGVDEVCHSAGGGAGG